jgi:predicted dehydrogenase
MRLAQVGYGYWGRNLMRVFSAMNKAQMVLCCESDANARALAQETYPAVEVCDEYSEVTARKDIDAVVIATPAASHYEQSKIALQANKHVFVEKPLALTVEEANELVELAESSKRTLMVGHTFLYNDAVRCAKDYIDRGELGEVYYTYFQRLSLGRVRQDVNAMWNLAPHDVSISQYWYGETPSRVQAQGVSYIQDGIDDVNFITLLYPSGRFAHIHISWLDPLKTRRAVIVGSKKMIVYDDTSADQKIAVFDKGIDRTSIKDDVGSVPFEDFGQFTLIHRAGDILIPKINFREPLQVEARHFVECIETGKRPLTDGRNGLEVVRTLEAAQLSCKPSQAGGS